MLAIQAALVLQLQAEHLAVPAIAEAVKVVVALTIVAAQDLHTTEGHIKVDSKEATTADQDLTTAIVAQAQPRQLLREQQLLRVQQLAALRQQAVALIADQADTIQTLITDQALAHTAADPQVVDTKDVNSEEKVPLKLIALTEELQHAKYA